MDKISDFRQLISWQEGHKLVLLIYKAAKNFPREEIYGLSSQMKRAAVSVTSNIAEGFGRRSYKEKIYFYYLSQGSLIELKNQIEVSKDIKYISFTDYEKLIEQADCAHKLLQGLITKSRTFISS